jgi:competence protein ComGC
MLAFLLPLPLVLSSFELLLMRIIINIIYLFNIVLMSRIRQSNERLDDTENSGIFKTLTRQWNIPEMKRYSREAHDTCN